MINRIFFVFFICLFTNVYAATKQENVNPNLIRNPSFENGWHYWFWGYNTRTPATFRKELDPNHVYDGKYSCVGGINSYNIRLHPLKKYTLSFYATNLTDRETKAEVRIKDCQGRKIRTFFNIIGDWKRYTWTFNITPGWDDFARVQLIAKNNVRIDAVKIEAGEKATPFQPPKFSLGLLTKRPSHMFLDNEKCVITVRLRNTEKKTGRILLKYSVKDYFDKPILNSEKEMTLNGEEFQDFPIELNIDRLGMFTADFSVSVNNRLEWTDTTCFSRFKKPENKQPMMGFQATYSYLPYNKYEEVAEILETVGAKLNRIAPNRYVMAPNNWDRVRKFLEICDKRGVKFTWIIGSPTYESIGKKYEGKKPRRNYEHTHLTVNTPEEEKSWGEYVARVVKAFKGLVDCWGIGGEPTWGYTAEGYVSILKPAYLAAKRVNPDCTIVGGSVPSLTPAVNDWSFQVLLDNKGIDYMDVFAIHPYSRKPEDKTSLECLEKLKEAIAKTGKKIPVWNTELGWRAYHNLKVDIDFFKGLQGKYVANTTRNYKYNKWDKLLAAFHARAALIEKAHGIDHYMAHSWATDYGPHCASKDGQLVLLPMMGIVNCINILLDGVKHAEKVPLGAIEAYLYEKKDNTTLVALWFPSEDETMSIDLKLPQTGNFQNINCIDIMNNRTPAEAGQEIKISSTPMFLEFTGGIPSSEIKTFLSSSKLTIDNPVDFSVKMASARQLQVNIKNLRIKPFDGQVSVSFPDGWGKNEIRKINNLKSGRSISLVFPVKIPFDKIVPLQSYPIEISFKTNDGFMLQKKETITPLLTYELKKPVVLDGDLSDWDGIEPVPLNRKNLCVSDKFPIAGWAGPSDLSAEMRLGWDRQNLYIALSVKDDLFLPYDGSDDKHKHMKAKYSYLGDSVQLFFDTKNNGTIKQRSMGMDDYNYNIALIDGTPQAYRNFTAEFQESGNRVGMARITVAIKESPGAIIYELKIPNPDLYPFQIKPNAVTGFSLQINDKDQVDAGKCENVLSTSPSKFMPWKNTGYYPDLIFVKTGNETDKVETIEFSKDGGFYTPDGSFHIGISRKNGKLNIVKNETPLTSQNLMTLRTPEGYLSQTNGKLKTVVNTESKTVETIGKVKEIDFRQKVYLKNNIINVDIRYSVPETFKLKKPCYQMDLSEALYLGKKYRADGKIKTYSPAYDKERPVLSHGIKEYESLVDSNLNFKINVLRGHLKVLDQRGWGKGYSVRIYPQKTANGGKLLFTIEP